MSHNHTPGPWTAKPHGDGWHITAHTPMPNGGKLFCRIATVHGMQASDAKLIASAPELFALLKNAVYAEDNRHKPGFGDVSLGSLSTAIRAALAKAVQS